MTKKEIKKRNRIISYILAGLTAYILIVNNSLEFLRNFGIDVNISILQVVMIFITLGWVFWKAGAGEL